MRTVTEHRLTPVRRSPANLGLWPTLRYTSHASVRQNPRTTRAGSASDRAVDPVNHHTGVPASPCSIPSASACARRSADLTGRGRISEADVDAAMREIRLALLEADVNFKVVKDFVGARPRAGHRRTRSSRA